MRARWLTVALVPLGTLGGHALGYLAAGQEAAFTGAHSHLRPTLWLALAASAAAVAAMAVAGAEGGRLRPRTRTMVGAQVVLFGLLEAVEHLHAGHHLHSLAADPSFRWGLAAQLVSAGLLVLVAGLARASGQLVRECRARRQVVPRSTPRPRWHHVDPSLPSARAASSVSERGPPWSPVAA